MGTEEHNTFVGIDQALRKTGICFLSSDHVIELEVLDTFKKKLEGPARLAYIRDWLHEQLWERKIAQAAMEAGAYRGSGRVFQLGGVSALVQVALWDHGIPFVIARPDQVKKHFTGYLNSTKQQMVDHAKKVLGLDLTDDEADAYALACIARDMYCDSAQTRKQAEVIVKLREEGRLHEPSTAHRPNAYGVAPGG